MAMNDRGDVIGRADSSTATTVFLWRKGTMIELGRLGVPLSLPIDVNERGQIVGVSFDATGTILGFLWNKGNMIHLGTLG